MFERLSYDLVKTLFKSVVAILPLVVWYPAWRYAHTLWGDALLGWYRGGLSPQSTIYQLAYAAWPSVRACWAGRHNGRQRCFCADPDSQCR